MSVTKNKLSFETICQMAKKAFPEKNVKTAEELTEGLCNTAYRIDFTDGSKSILKVASGSNEGYLSNEINMMETEVKAMRIMRDSGAVRVAEVQYYDKSKTICSGAYFFMEALEGQSCFSLHDSFTEEEMAQLDFESGQVERRIASVTNSRFGFLGSEEYQFDCLYGFVRKLFENVLNDMKARNIQIKPSPEEIFPILEKDKKYFDEVKQAALTHMDMWEGNIFVTDKHICGIIDWERAMWAEPLLDALFRSDKRNINMLKGYGQTEFSYAEKRRILWYDLLLYLTMKTEGFYRGYGTPESTAEVQKNIDDTYSELVVLL
ncbi:MAG: aminoglycoside phosphotransferase family protein [Oscillospiraceae bacterium]|nr:aminoglycoside phosphotransferase family protein [Oscillospiraceae bacterium]